MPQLKQFFFIERFCFLVKGGVGCYFASNFYYNKALCPFLDDNAPHVSRQP